MADRKGRQRGNSVEDIFKRSMRTARSPDEKEEESVLVRLMTEVKLEMADLKKDLKGEISDIRRNLEEMKKKMDGLEKMKDDIREINKMGEGMESRLVGVERRVSKLEKDKEQGVRIEKDERGKVEELEAMITRMEVSREEEDKRRRRNNIVVRGWVRSQRNNEEEVEKYLERELGVKVRIEEVIAVGRPDTGITVVRLSSWEEKREVMRNKHKLRGSKVYIDDDLTPKERVTQALVRKKASEKVKGGERIRVGYRKAIIGEELWVWDELRGDLVAKNGKDGKLQGK